MSEAAVRKALGSGRIALEPDGTIDAAKADWMWASRTDPSRQRGVHAQELQAATAAGTARAQAQAGTKPVPRAALEAVEQVLGDAGAPAGGEDAGGGGEVSFLRARMANEVLKAQTAKVRLGKMKGELVDRARATAFVFDLARRERDAWIGWPPRVAANMAAEMGVDPHLMEQVLERYLREQLAELAEVKVALR